MSLNKTKFYQTGFIILLVWSVLFLIVSVGTGHLAQYLGTGVIPGIIEKYGITQYAFDIRRIGLSGLDAGPVRIGPEENPALMIQSITVDYSPGDLLRKKAGLIRLNSATIRCGMKNGEFFFPGLDMQKILNRSEENTSGPFSAPPAIPVDRVEIHDSTLLFTWEGHEYRIPFDVVVDIKEENRFSAKVELFPRNQPIAITGDILPAENIIRVSIMSSNLQISRFTDIIENVQGLGLKGEMRIAADAKLNLSPFTIASVDADLTWKKMQIDYGTVRIKNADMTKPAEDVLTVRVIHEKDKSWQISMSGMSMMSPVPLTFSDSFFDLSADKNGISARSNMLIRNRISPIPSLPSLKVLEPVHTMAALSADYNYTGEWKVSVSNTHDGKGQKGHFEDKGMDIVMGVPVFNITASGKKSAATADWTVSVPDIHVRSADTAVSVSAVKAMGKGKLGENLVSADIRFDLHDTGIQSGTTQLKIPAMALYGHVSRADKKDPAFNGKFILSKAGVTDTDASLAIKGIQASVPLSWPVKSSGSPGSFSVDSVTVRDFVLGSAKGMIRQKGQGIGWQGTHAGRLLPGLAAEFSGDGGIDETGGYAVHVRFNIPEYTPESELDLGRFSPEAKGILFSGTLQSRGEINVTSGGTGGFLEASLNDGLVRSEEDDFRIEGISGEVRFPKLPGIESAPDQKIGFAKASFGEIVMETGEVRYKVESPESFFIEKAGFGWCNGRIETRSFRILTELEDYDVIFYCAQLDLAQVIQQITPYSAEGGGTVSGRIPLRYKSGDIAFNNGFLFSEPGVTGRIKIRETEMLTEGIMAGAPKFTQLVIAREALKNYEYKWAKLEVNTQKENLHVSLQFDGKPVHAMPFYLDKKTGQLVKDDSGRSKALFDNGISLNINTNLPLNDIIKYKDVITKKLK